MRKYETCANGLVVLTFFNSSHIYFVTAGMFCIILNPPTDHIFQSVISVMIFDTYIQSVSGVLLPFHGCWGNPTHLSNIDNGVSTAFELCSNIFCFADIHIYPHTKKNYQGDSNHN